MLRTRLLSCLFLTLPLAALACGGGTNNTSSDNGNGGEGGEGGAGGAGGSGGTGMGGQDPGVPSGAVDPSFAAPSFSFYPTQIAEKKGQLLFGHEYIYNTNELGTDGVLGNVFLLREVGAFGAFHPYLAAEPISACTFDGAFALGTCVALPESEKRFLKAILPRASGGATLVLENQNVDVSMYRVELARLGADGSFDTSFGAAGYLTVMTGVAEILEPVTAIKLPDGRIVVSATGPVYAPRLLVLADDGAIDPTFGTGGIDATSGSGQLAAHPDGGFVLASSYNGNYSVSRYKADRTLDTSFGTGGRVDAELLTQSNFDDDYTTRSVFVAKSGAIYLGAERKYNEVDSGIVMKLDSSGKLVPSFGEGGIARQFGVEGTAGSVYAITEDEAGKILVSLAIVPPGGNFATSAKIVRLIP